HLYFYCSAAHRALPSFPTRRSSDLRLRPRDEKALELLAGVYANPNWIGADGLERAAAIYFQVARRRQEAGDADNAVAALRRALRSEEHTSELQSPYDLVCRLLLEKK